MTHSVVLRQASSTRAITYAEHDASLQDAFRLALSGGRTLFEVDGPE
jgi:hypothetical protein